MELRRELRVGENGGATMPLRERLAESGQTHSQVSHGVRRLPEASKQITTNSTENTHNPMIISRHHRQKADNLPQFRAIIRPHINCLTHKKSPRDNKIVKSLRSHQDSKWILSLILLCLAPVPATNGFNLDAGSAIIHSGPAGSYFGYSVAQHRDQGVFSLLVGAPKAQTSQSRVKEGGAMYKCSVSSVRGCQQISFDPNGSGSIQLRNESRQMEDKSYQFFGASLASATDNGSIVVCAPKYVYFSANLRRRDPVGTCWLSRGSFNGFFEYSPCRLADQWGHHHLGSCQAGFSAAITKDGAKLFMGAPGSHVWQGQVFGHNLRNDLHGSTSPVNPHDEDDSYLGYSLAIGRFSATSGSSGGVAEEIAVGIPRASDLAGKVMLVDRDLKTLRNITGEQVGSYFGYALAAADLNGDGKDELLIGAPLFYNNTIKEGHSERGRVYVVANLAGRGEPVVVARLDGARNGARFGHSIALAGDLNRDGAQDVAIGAPYDGPDSRGAVYIYLGRKSAHSSILSSSSSQMMISNEPDQVIYAEDLPRFEARSMQTFGFSLAGGLDVDANQYADLLVGAYKADKAVLLRARPVVNVTSSLQFSPDHFNLDDKSCLLPNSSQPVPCVSVTYCLKYSGLNVDQRLPFTVDIKLDSERPQKGQPRLFFLQDPGKSDERNSTSLTKDVNQCRTFKAYILRQIRDKLTPLRVDVDYAIADSYQPSGTGEGQLPQLKPVLAKTGHNHHQQQQSAAKLTKAAGIQKNCGPNNVCVPDLKLQVQPNLDPYTMGSNQQLVLDVTVRNVGQDAFESMFYLTMPQTIDFIAVNKSRSDYPLCSPPRPDATGANLLTCDLGNPMPRNDVLKFQVITEPSRYTLGKSADFSFMATVNSTNPELDDRHREDNEVPVGIRVRVEANLVLRGSSQPPLIIHNATQLQIAQEQQQIQSQVKPAIDRPRLLEIDIGPEVQHVYQLENKGPSQVEDVAVTILWPSMNSLGQYLLYLVDEPQTSSNVRCKPAPAGSINPLNLRYLPANLALPQTSSGGVRLLRREVQHQLEIREPSNLIDPMVNSSTSGATVDQSVLEQLNLLQCGPSQCTKFECNVLNLANGETATIKFRSRLNLDTISQTGRAEFDISSKMVAQIKALPYNVSTRSMPPYLHKVETQVRTVGMSVVNMLPWWLVLLAILLGLLLFILLACFLKYLGFFARKRPPKGVEREPLTPTMWKDYHFTPGDTAL